MSRQLKTLTNLLIIISIFLFAATAVAKEKKKPDGYIEVEATQVAIGVGLGWGKGELIYGAGRYPFKVRGFSLLGVGFTTSEITGNVYNLTKPEDLAGSYTLGAVGGTLGKGAAAGKMKNEKGVVIEAWTTEKGLDISIGGSGLTIEMIGSAKPAAATPKEKYPQEH